ncbi:MAG: NADH-quinone oxidoreductase subunit K [Geminicoccaceae bacterium]
MSPDLLFTATGCSLFALGFKGVIASTAPMRRLIAANVMGVGVFTVLIATAYRPDGPSDPVPHALVITGIVVAVCATALGLALARAVHAAEQAR